MNEDLASILWTSSGLLTTSFQGSETLLVTKNRGNGYKSQGRTGRGKKGSRGKGGSRGRGAARAVGQ